MASCAFSIKTTRPRARRRSWNCRPPNSYAAFCSTSCPLASYGSVTMGCSLIARDRPSSPAPASSWPSWPLPPRPSCRLLSSRTEVTHLPLPHAARAVLGVTGALALASHLSEVRHEARSLPRSLTASLALLPPHNFPYRAGCSRASTVRLCPRRARPYHHNAYASPSVSVVASAPASAPLPWLPSDNHWQSFPDALESP
jgi:hypothetical protein